MSVENTDRLETVSEKVDFNRGFEWWRMSGGLIKADCSRQMGQYKGMIFCQIVFCLQEGWQRYGCQMQNIIPQVFFQRLVESITSRCQQWIQTKGGCIYYTQKRTFWLLPVNTTAVIFASVLLASHVILPFVTVTQTRWNRWISVKVWMRRQILMLTSIFNVLLLLLLFLSLSFW